HRPGQRPREPHPVRDAGQQRTPSIPHQTRTVRRHSQLLNQPITLHHLGDPPEVAMRVSATRTLPAQSDVSAPRPARGPALNARSRLMVSQTRSVAVTASLKVLAVPWKRGAFLVISTVRPDGRADVFGGAPTWKRCSRETRSSPPAQRSS